MSASVVPARAGMSPVKLVGESLTEGGPRASGDEPIERARDGAHNEWSPRERG